jgi:hypothetical protein
MIAMKRLNQTAMQRLFFIPVAFLVLVMTLSSTSQSRAFGVEGTSIQTSCINSQPCQTIVCSEGQPCKVSETPNIDFDFEPDSLSQPLEGTSTGTDAGTSGLAPYNDPYNNIYTEDQEEYLEDRQDMIEDAEFE